VVSHAEPEIVLALLANSDRETLLRLGGFRRYKRSEHLAPDERSLSLHGAKAYAAIEGAA
jgi:hypothetical protein